MLFTFICLKFFLRKNLKVTANAWELSSTGKVETLISIACGGPFNSLRQMPSPLLLLCSFWSLAELNSSYIWILPSSSPFLPTVPSTWNALPLRRVHPWPLPPTNSFSGTNNTSSVMIPSLTPGSKSVFSSCCKHQFSPSCYYLYISICKFPSRLSYWMWRTCFISFISIYFSCIHFSVFISWWWGPQYLGTVNKCCIWMNILYYF